MAALPALSPDSLSFSPSPFVASPLILFFFFCYSPRKILFFFAPFFLCYYDILFFLCSVSLSVDTVKKASGSALLKKVDNDLADELDDLARLLEKSRV